MNDLWTEAVDLISTTSTKFLKYFIDRYGMLISESNAQIPWTIRYNLFLFEGKTRQRLNGTFRIAFFKTFLQIIT